MLSPLNSSSLNNTQSLIQQNIQRISSGKSINSAADNPAGLAIVDAMSSQLNGQNQAISNVTSGLSITDIADGALSQVTDSLQQIRDLTVQAGNGSLSGSDLQSIQNQINSLGQNIDDISANTQFNGQPLLDGSFSGHLQVGPNSGDTLSLNLSNVSSTALGVSGLNVSTTANATSALSSIDNAINSVSSMQSNVASTAAGLNSNLSNLNSSYQQLAQSQSRIQDTDYAQAISDLSQANVKNQVSIYALKLYQDNQNMSTTSLLNVQKVTA